MTTAITYKKWNGQTIFWAVLFVVVLLWTAFAAVYRFSSGDALWGWFNVVFFALYLPLALWLTRAHQRMAYNLAINTKSHEILDENWKLLDLANELNNRKEYDAALSALDKVHANTAQLDKLPERDYRFFSLKAPGVA